MSQPRQPNAKLFTPEQANAMLPLVRAIVTDLSRLSRDLLERRERLSVLMRVRGDDQDDPFSAEVLQVQEELEKDSHRLREYVDELLELGVEPKNGMEGLVDFPAMIDGRLVYLCWKLDEPEILFWHDLEAGFSGRQPLQIQPLAAD
ncbi:MAG: DUF2203 domain-containing protein [Pirellulales bacterium]